VFNSIGQGEERGRRGEGFSQAFELRALLSKRTLSLNKEEEENKKEGGDNPVKRLKRSLGKKAPGSGRRGGKNNPKHA